MQVEPRVTAVLEALDGVKEITLGETLAILQALHEKHKSGEDAMFKHLDPYEFVDAFFENGIEDIQSFMREQEEAAAEAEAEAEEREDRRRGFDTYNGFSIPAWGY